MRLMLPLYCGMQPAVPQSINNFTDGKFLKSCILEIYDLIIFFKFGKKDEFTLTNLPFTNKIALHSDP